MSVGEKPIRYEKLAHIVAQAAPGNNFLAVDDTDLIDRIAWLRVNVYGVKAATRGGFTDLEAKMFAGLGMEQI